MKDIKTFAKTHLPKSLVQLLRKQFARNKNHMGKYFSITLTDEEITRGKYKKYLGGGPKSWESRGAFQLFFLQEMGMLKSSKVLDVGCGPGRASKYLIEFLDEENYYGVDYNADFIKAAYAISEKSKLSVKKPSFEVVQDFNFAHIEPIFDYAIVFSVLNHCNIDQRKVFFRMIPKPLKEGGKVYISHARWFTESYISKTRMKLTKQFGPNDFDITKYGWEKRDSIFPIIELTRCR